MENTVTPCTGTKRWFNAPRRAAFVASLGLLAISLVSVSLVRATARRAIDEEVRGNLVRLSSTLASSVNPEHHALLTDASQEGSEAYTRLNRPLEQVLINTPGVRFAYSLREIGGELYFVLDGSPIGDSDNDGVEDHSFLMDHYEDPDPAAIAAIRTGAFQVSEEPYEDQWGRFLSAYAPITMPDGTIDGVMGVDVTADDYELRLANVDHAALFAMIPGVAISALCGWGVFWATRRIKHHAEEVEDHRHEAVRASEAKSRLVANLSHELRTPLSAVMGFSEIAFDESNPESKRAEARTTTRRNCEHLIALLNDLLDLSKAEAGAIEIEPEPLEVDLLVRGAVAPSRLRAQNKGIVLDVFVDDAVPERVAVDPIRVRQVLSNLVSNAVKFTDLGSVQVSVSVSDEGLVFEIRDSGPGMDAEQVSGLFRPFSQVGGSAETKSKGAGLGLALCHHLLGLMGGTVTVDSEPGKGSVFTVVVPYTEVRTPGSKPLIHPTPGSTLEGARIMLAEDGEDNRRLIRFFLERAHAEVIEFHDGQQALEGYRDGIVPDLVLTDWDMPVLDGAGLVKGLRDSGWTGPVVSLTAHAMAHQEQECLDAGCDAHLTKPVNWDHLIGTCAALIEQNQAKRAA